MQQDFSFPGLQEPTGRVYPQQDSSKPLLLIQILKSMSILSSCLRLGFPSGLFPSQFPTNILYKFRFSPTKRPKLYKMGIIVIALNYEASLFYLTTLICYFETLLCRACMRSTEWTSVNTMSRKDVAKNICHIK